MSGSQMATPRAHSIGPISAVAPATSSESPLLVYHSRNSLPNQSMGRTGAYGWMPALTFDRTNVVTLDLGSLLFQNLGRTVLVLQADQHDCPADWSWTHQAGRPSPDFGLDLVTEGVLCGLRAAPIFVRSSVHQNPAEAFRALTGLPIDRLADLIGVSRSTYHNWLAGKPISPDRGARLQAVSRLFKKVERLSGARSDLREWLLQNKVGQEAYQAIVNDRLDLAEALALRVVRRASPMQEGTASRLAAAAGAPFAGRALAPRRAGASQSAGAAHPTEREILGHAATLDESPGEEDLDSWIATSFAGAWPQAG